VTGRLQGKRALIYGGASGLGFACAAAMIGEGAAVFLSGRRAERLAQAVEKLSAKDRAGYEAGDATLEADVQRVTKAAVKFLRGLDTMVISAGTAGITPILSTSLEEFRAICDGNLTSTFLACRYGAPHMVENGSGSIIAISSIFGLVGEVERVGYCASKHGVIGLVRAAALDLAGKRRARQCALPRLCRNRALARDGLPRVRSASGIAQAADDASDPPLWPD
jgi:NAD(P)-dependent dehydrogenase (short-subunit alcohol dehydrogenase family)